MHSRIINCALGLLAGGILLMLFALAFLNAIAREDRMRDGIRRERCARYGERLPPPMKPYCDNLGV